MEEGMSFLELLSADGQNGGHRSFGNEFDKSACTTIWPSGQQVSSTMELGESSQSVNLVEEPSTIYPEAASQPECTLNIFDRMPNSGLVHDHVDDETDEGLYSSCSGSDCDMDKEDLHNDIFCAMPPDHDTMYDYDFPISDTERSEVSVTPIAFNKVEDNSENVAWKKRKRVAKGAILPNCRKSVGMGAVETALRRSAKRTTVHIFQPAVGMTFDSVGEAHNFYNLYSWEVGFGIRYGKSNKNQLTGYRSMQQIECACGGIDNRVQFKTKCCNCKVMIRLHRTDDNGWYISRMDDEHNHVRP